MRKIKLGHSIWAIALLPLVLQFSFSAGAEESCDTVHGKRIFTKCAVCHSLTPDQHMMGPSLHNIRDKKAGAAEGYRYSMAMQHSDILWDEENLHKFIKSPMQFLPGTSMPFGGIRNEEDRKALLCLLSSSTTSVTTTSTEVTQ